MPSRGASPPARALVAALALAGAACPQRELGVHPFRVSVTDETGAPVTPIAGAGGVLCSGPGAKLDATTFTVRSPGSGCPAGLLTVRFDPAAAGAVSLPDSLFDGSSDVTLSGLYDAAARGPAGEPLPWRALRVGQGPDVITRYRFLLAEGDLQEDRGTAIVPLGPTDTAPDVPFLEIAVTSLYPEPSPCGDLYRDRLRVGGASADVVLEAGETATVATAGGEDLPAWRVVHVQSWHRGAGRSTGDCAGKLRSWTQVAASR